ncbi:hypothetical protein COT27_01410 [Candidatus Kuenenbacteria bacterium CG08_land_8_20_14_0_20_37_23]|uniref:Carbohydrate-binding module family 96 domain-containing protein n=1 Tax=Candidatus Kuenenbacteria bacterium CG08_land_8_20_14_0_20_37_23 TaxID=1974617 RepID=A0A2M6XSZ3_9BACT|nr:MAG: hypothetical protein COT27_01410 [Candidatus Kuenenbacteria bacterium CG08_land_8_20_14_0_20_37_23]
MRGLFQDKKFKINFTKGFLGLAVLGFVGIIILVSLGVMWEKSGIVKNNNASFMLPEKYDEPLIIRNFGNVLSFVPLESNAAGLIHESENRVKYIDAYKNTDVAQEIQEYKLKEDIILKSLGHPLEFKYKLNIENFKWEKNENGDLVFYKKNNGVNEDKELYKFFTILAPFMIDANGQKSNFSEVQTNLGENGILILKINEAWLENHSYPIILDPTIEINIINLHSYPETGEDWVIKFTTKGKNDLKIEPYDQATIDEDEFVGLYCGDEKRMPQILEKDIIYYSKWECGGVAKVVHQTLVKGTHTFKFWFGDEWAFAYNGSVTEQWGENSNCEYTGVTEDTYIDQVQSNYNMGSTNSIRVGEDNATGGRDERSMIKFNLNALDGLITSENQIVSAMLYVKTYDDPDPGNIWVDAFRINKNWNGGTTDYAVANDSADEVTWTYQYYDETSWTTAGLGSSDRSATYDDRAYFDADLTWESFDVTDSVKYMFTNNQDYGWILVSESETSNIYWRVYAANSTTAKNRPYLSITYNDNSAPTISSIIDSPDPIGVGSPITFSVDWNDADSGDMVKAVICKGSGITTSTAVCKDGEWARSPVYTNRDPENQVFYTTLADDKDNTRNYWAFVCDDGAACSDGTAGSFTVVNQRPDGPVGLLVEGKEVGNVINIDDTTPEFSAVYYDTDDEGDVGEKYCVEVDTQADFLGTDMWISDSASCYTGSALGANVAVGARSENLIYGGAALGIEGATYYWRMWFWDGEERSATSTTGWFTMADQSAGWGTRINGGLRLKGGVRLK